MKLSLRTTKIKPSSTLAITAKAAELRAEGKDVISFSVGEPDFHTPENIKEAGIKAIQDGFTKYTPVPGIPELRKAICEKLKNDNGLDYKPEQIVVSNGAKQSISNILLALLDEGDEVIIPVPYWLSYSAMVEIAGGKCVFIETKKENSFMVTKEELEAALTPKTKVLFLTSPSNPTGMVYSKEQLEVVADFAVKNDILVISDEIYEKLIYDDNKKHISIASLGEEICDRTVVINGVSKSYAMTGWRIGYAACPLDIAKAVSSIQSHMTSNACSISQKATLEAIVGTQTCVDEMVKEFAKRRDYIFEREENIPLISALKPEGAFYLFMDVSATYGKKYKGEEITSAADMARMLIEDKSIAVVPCADFGSPEYIRISYATSMENIKKGMDRIEEFISELK